MSMKHILWAAVAAALLVPLLVGLDPAEAGKPSKPPPPPPPSLDSGHIYFERAGEQWVMKPDGSGKEKVATLPLGTPSHALHGGQRWFLQFRPVSTQTDPETYPNGLPRQELYAVDEAGNACQLTDDALVEPDPGAAGPSPAWARDGEVIDGKVSFLGKTWAQDSNDKWYVADWGLYVVVIDPDDLTNHAPASPTLIPVDFDLLGVTSEYGYGGALNTSFDWSPDGESFTFQRYNSYVGIWRADLQGSSWGVTRLTTFGSDPCWSALGRIAFCDGVTAFYVMDSDGRNCTKVVSESKKWIRYPDWSPAGTHLVYWCSDLKTSNVYRVAADGSGKTDLTSDTSDNAVPELWVGD